MERDWTYFVYLVIGTVALWLTFRGRRRGGGGQIAIVGAIIAVMLALYLTAGAG